jgi:hypothetical protein
VLVGAVLAFACGSKSSPTQPSTPTTPAAPTITAITVGVPGNGSTTLAPGEKLQLFAQAQYSDGTTADLTNVATWQSSSPVVAIVSSSGLVTAAAEGEVDISAAYVSRVGSLHAQIQKPSCYATVSPGSLVYSAFGSSASVQVTTSRSDCRWTARSDAAWLPVNFDPNRSGSGLFTYTVPPNSGTEPRSAHVMISVTGGPSAVHSVTQERPVSCSYVVSPAKLTLPASGGAGAFDVETTPADCRWTVDNSGESGVVKVTLTGPTSGTGAAHITYSTAANNFTFDAVYTIEIRGLSGVNPPGVHTVTISRK